MKTGMVLEGGAMRGMFTAGVMDVMMENKIKVDGAVGVSAGAVFGCNYKSSQIGRVFRYNTAYCRDPRYAGFRSLIKTGDIYGEQFCYHDIPERLDPFDTKAYENNPMEFYVVCTDVMTGEPVYHRCDHGDAGDLLWMRASASMPMVSRIVEVEGRLLLDGGIGDSIPLKFSESIGYEKNIVILTQPGNYVKKKNKMLPLLRISLRRYPNMIRAIENRHDRYNQTLEYIKQREKTGDALVIRPPHPLNIGAVEHDARELRRVYEIGRAEGKRRLDELKKYTEGI